MTAVIIIAAVAAVVMLLLFLPVSFAAEYDGSFSYKISFGGVPIPIAKKKTQKCGKHAVEEKPQPQQKDNKKQKPNPFSEIYQREGFAAATRAVTEFGRRVLGHVGIVIKSIKVTDFYLDLRVAAENAAQTAVEYGAVCSVLYPFLSGLYSLFDFSARQIDIKADFDSRKPTVKFAVKLSLRMVTLLIAAIKILSDYKKLIKEGASDERK